MKAFRIIVAVAAFVAFTIIVQTQTRPALDSRPMGRVALVRSPRLLRPKPRAISPGPDPRHDGFVARTPSPAAACGVLSDDPKQNQIDVEMKAAGRMLGTTWLPDLSRRS